jgi:hypothetical protein
LIQYLACSWRFITKVVGVLEKVEKSKVFIEITGIMRIHIGEYVVNCEFIGCNASLIVDCVSRRHRRCLVCEPGIRVSAAAASYDFSSFASVVAKTRDILQVVVPSPARMLVFAAP